MSNWKTIGEDGSELELRVRPGHHGQLGRKVRSGIPRAWFVEFHEDGRLLFARIFKKQIEAFEFAEQIAEQNRMREQSNDG